MCAHRTLCRTMSRLRIAWAGLLPSGNHSDAHGFELYCRLFDHYQVFDEEVAAAEHPKSMLKRLGLDITQRDIRATRHLHRRRPARHGAHPHRRPRCSRTSLEPPRLASRSSVCAQFLWDIEYPTLSSVWDPHVEESGIADLTTRSSLMRVIAQTNQAKGSLDWDVDDVSKETIRLLLRSRCIRGRCRAGRIEQRGRRIKHHEHFLQTSPRFLTSVSYILQKRAHNLISHTILRSRRADRAGAHMCLSPV
ncbi:hypothetical protein BDV98DRAFT_376212 [Pterulicium gracile]|uniref:Uncharacterized protein n=1 Tax=Pterulicium gracile TaxID=1884261 RepID=A0A5C3Q398_9AGAR|nr:hypothetical protein BDV98DRAFT_376212 [Pterula gracilis]